MSIPAELERREKHLAAIAAAKTKIAARAAARFAREHAEYEAKRAAACCPRRGHRQEAWRHRPQGPDTGSTGG